MCWILPVDAIVGLFDSTMSTYQLTYLELYREEDMVLWLPICAEKERHCFSITLKQTSCCFQSRGNTSTSCVID